MAEGSGSMRGGPDFPTPPAPRTYGSPAPATVSAPPPQTSVPQPSTEAGRRSVPPSESLEVFVIPAAPLLPPAAEPRPARRPVPKQGRSRATKPPTKRASGRAIAEAAREAAAAAHMPAPPPPEPTLFDGSDMNPATLDPKTANILYHDWEAASYDDKWSISFDERITSYAREKFLKVMPEDKYGSVLEIGAGTGFFIINLWLAGLVSKAYATDISPGMVEVCLRNAHAAGLMDLEGRAADAEALPFEDGTFDLVVGHAVLHHLPNVEAALAECMRVLKPGGSLVITGEPTRIGHAIVHLAQRATATAFKGLGRVVPRILKRPEAGPTDPAAALERHVDLHEFSPGRVRDWLSKAGFEAINVQTEELVSGLFGWSARTIEALAAPGLLGDRWPWFAYHAYMRLYRFDHAVMRRLVPKPLFYNLLFSARKPGG